MAAEVSSTGTGSKVADWMRLAALESSTTPMAYAREESLSSDTPLFTSGGRLMRSAWGSITEKKMVNLERPSASAASICPLGTESSPERMASAL